MSITWDYFCKRTGTNLSRFLEKNKIKSYDDFCSIATGRNLADLPPREEVESLFPQPKEIDIFIPKAKPAGRKRPSKSPALQTESSKEVKAKKPAKAKR